MYFTKLSTDFFFGCALYWNQVPAHILLLLMSVKDPLVIAVIVIES